MKAIDDACVEVTMSVFSEADLMKDGLISFEEFAEWYTQGGYNTIPWLELLDLKKWPYEEIDDSKYENIEDDLAVEEYDDDEDDYDVDSLNNNPSSTADANSIPIDKHDADKAFDAATCIGCGACVATCKNASAMLFVSAKVSQYALLPQGKVEATDRVINMVKQMDEEGFGNCTNTGACEVECPKGISLENIARMNREYLFASLKG